MRYLFVTGKLAEPALRRTLAELAPRAGFAYDVAVLNVSVAALLTPKWIAGHLTVPENVDRIMLPGYCGGDLTPVREQTHVPIERGPKDLRDLPDHFGKPAIKDYGAYDVEILAEINHAQRLDRKTIHAMAHHYRSSGADVIDVGCDPGETWTGVGDVVRMLKDEGLRVSVDSMDIAEINLATRAGAELVLSVHAINRHAAPDWGCEVVAIPDTPSDLASLDGTVDFLSNKNVPFRIDPIIEPIGCGFALSLGRYLTVRQRYPNVAMMMGVGNLTELTDVDSAGVNVLLMGFCQEVGIGSVLTTEVINWARSSVKELDFARRLTHYACHHGIPPKHLEKNLHVVRAPRLRQPSDDELNELASRVRDRNYRLFAANGLIHAINGQGHLRGSDPFVLFDQLQKRDDMDPSHAFYLGYEMAKAVMALTLSKNYVQDEALDWGYLTVPEQSHRDRMHQRNEDETHRSTP